MCPPMYFYRMSANTLPPLRQAYLKGGHTDSIICLASAQPFTPNAGHLLSGSADGTARLWDTRTPLDTSASLLKTTIRATVEDAEITAVRFAEPYLSRSIMQPGSLPVEEETEFEQYRALYAQREAELMNRSMHTVFVAYDNRVFEYDLRVRDVIAQHVAVSAPFEDEITYITCSPDGREVAVCNDDGSISLIPLYQCPGLSISEEKPSQFPETFSPGTLATSSQYAGHENICMSAVYDPLCPFSVAGCGGYPLITGAMDYHLRYWAPAFMTPLVSNLSKLSPSSVASYVTPVGTSARMVNPPFVNAVSLSSDGGLLAAGLGSGEILLSMPNRRLADQTMQRLHYFSCILDGVETPCINEALLHSELARGVQDPSTADYYPLPDGKNKFPEISLGNLGGLEQISAIRGHLHSIVALEFAKFTSSHYNCTTATRYGYQGLFAHMPSKNTVAEVVKQLHDHNGDTAAYFTDSSMYSTLAKSALTFNSLNIRGYRPLCPTSASVDAEAIGLYSNIEHQSMAYTLNSMLRQQFGFHRNVYSDIQSNKNYAHTPFVASDVLVTAGLDSTLVLWSGLQQHCWERYSEICAQRSPIIPGGRGSGSSRNNNNKAMLAAKQAQMKEQQRDKLMRQCKEWHLEDCMGVDWSFEEEDNYLCDIYTRECLITEQMGDVDGYESSQLIEGWYTDATKRASEMKALDSELIRARIKLPYKPNCMTTDSNGWAWVGDGSPTIQGYNLVKE